MEEEGVSGGCSGPAQVRLLLVTREDSVLNPHQRLWSQRWTTGGAVFMLEVNRTSRSSQMQEMMWFCRVGESNETQA